MMRAGQASHADKIEEPQRGAEQDSRLLPGSHAFLLVVAAHVQEAVNEKKQKAAGLIT